MALRSDVLACTACGARLPAPAKFCLECGAPVASAPTVEVRKTVTLLFTDVTGSTAMGELLDPEAYRNVMGRYFACSRAAIEAHGGTVEKFVGDAVLAVFGVPEVREDDALRAVRAAAELNAAVRRLSDELMVELGVRLQIRTGVNTGAVVAGSARAGGSFATGDAVNTAARLEQAAAPGEVLMGRATYELVRDAVSVEEAEPVRAKGKAEPVPAYRLLEVDEGAAGRRRHLDAVLVGRGRESRALDEALDRTVETNRGHLVTVLGAPGIGKTRLVAEFLERVGDRAASVSGRCVSYGQGITYWPIVQVVRDAAGLTGEESAEGTRHALTRLLPQAGHDAEAVDHLLALLGKGGRPGSSDQTFWAVARLLEQLALHRPLVVNLDDLHWAEPTLLELLERVREETSDLPLLLVCQARPELLDQHPHWAQGSVNSSVFGLEPFSSDDTATSLAALLGDDLGADVVAAVAEWSGGNPLFVEEIVTHLLETGLLVDEDGWRLTGDLASAGMPATVSALLAARLDRLHDDERALLGRIAVAGLEVGAEEAYVLGEPFPRADTDRLLGALARRDLLRRVRGPLADTWHFRHVLVREAAYAALSKATRVDLHLRLADHLDEHGAMAGSELQAFVAHHFLEAARYAAELAPHAPSTQEAADRAVRAGVEAACAARLRDDHDAAIALLGAVEELRPANPLRRELLLHALLQHNELYRYHDVARILDLLEHALAEGDRPTVLERASLALARADLAVSTSEDLDPESLLEPIEHVLELATASDDRIRAVLALHAQVEVHIMANRWADTDDVLARLVAIGDAQDGRTAQQYQVATALYGPHPLTTLVDRSVEIQAVTRSPQMLLRLRVTEVVGRLGRGDDDAPGLLDDLMVVFTGPEAPPESINSLIMRATACWYAGRLGEAITLFERCTDECRASDDLGHGSTYRAIQALLLLETGASPDLVQPIVDEAASWTSPYDVMSVSHVAAARALLAARDGRLAEAEELATTAIDMADRGDQWAQRADLRRWLSEIPHQRGDLDGERRLLVEARDLYAAKELRTWREVLERRLSEL